MGEENERGTKGMSRKSYLDDPETVKKIVKYWNKGLTYYDIADKCGIARSTIGTVVRELINMGVIEGRRRKLEQSVLVPGTVNCTTAVSRRCVYGISFQQSNSGCLCNYFLREGKLRGCPHNACTKFVEKDKDRHETVQTDDYIADMEEYNKIEKIEKEVEREAN